MDAAHLSTQRPITLPHHVEALPSAPLHPPLPPLEDPLHGHLPCGYPKSHAKQHTDRHCVPPLTLPPPPTRVWPQAYHPPPDLHSLLEQITSPDWYARMALPANAATLKVGVCTWWSGLRVND